MWKRDGRTALLLYLVTNWFAVAGAHRSGNALHSAQLANAVIAGILEIATVSLLTTSCEPGDAGKECEELMLFIEGRSDPSGKPYECPEWFRSQLKEGSAFMRLRPSGIA